MNDASRPHPLEGSVADYLNDHLSEAERDSFEQAMASDAHLREIVAFERRIQAVVAREAPAPASRTAFEQFEQFEQRLESPLFGIRKSGLHWIAGTAAVVLCALLIGYNAYNPGGLSDYETLSDAPAVSTEPVVRIVLSDSTDASALEALIREYDLKLINRLSSIGAVDVSVGSGDVAQVVRILENDARVRFAKVVAPSQ